jgi:hypothetical protein
MQQAAEKLMVTAPCGHGSVELERIISESGGVRSLVGIRTDVN